MTTAPAPLAINTNALPGVLGGKIGYVVNASRSKVETSELMAWLAGRLGRSASGVTNSIWRATKDERRLFTTAQRARIIARDAECCAYCSAFVVEGDRYIDHVIPHAAGGQTVDANGVLACGACNLSKSNKFW
jgi:hypothetical protein